MIKIIHDQSTCPHIQEVYWILKDIHHFAFSDFVLRTHISALLKERTIEFHNHLKLDWDIKIKLSPKVLKLEASTMIDSFQLEELAQSVEYLIVKYYPFKLPQFERLKFIKI